MGGVVLRKMIMPIYEFRNNETGEETEVILRIAEYDEYVKNNPHLSRFFSKPPALTSGSKSALAMAGSTWQEHLGNIKKGSGKSNTIKT
jgi:predicted nucleic acid-binding Zn ribbon protein